MRRRTYWYGDERERLRSTVDETIFKIPKGD